MSGWPRSALRWGSGVAAAAVNAPLFVIILVDTIKLGATSDATVADSAR